MHHPRDLFGLKSVFLLRAMAVLVLFLRAAPSTPLVLSIISFLFISYEKSDQQFKYSTHTSANYEEYPTAAPSPLSRTRCVTGLLLRVPLQIHRETLLNSIHEHHLHKQQQEVELG